MKQSTNVTVFCQRFKMIHAYILLIFYSYYVITAMAKDNRSVTLFVSYYDSRNREHESAWYPFLQRKNVVYQKPMDSTVPILKRMEKYKTIGNCRRMNDR